MSHHSVVHVRIYRPAKKATQSGLSHSHGWRMTFEPRSPGYCEPLMHWHSNDDTLQQVELSFETLDKALAYAQQKGWQADVEKSEPPSPTDATRIKPKSYDENYRAGRRFPWTH